MPEHRGGGAGDCSGCTACRGGCAAYRGGGAAYRGGAAADTPRRCVCVCVCFFLVGGGDSFLNLFTDSGRQLRSQVKPRCCLQTIAT